MTPWLLARARWIVLLALASPQARPVACAADAAFYLLKKGLEYSQSDPGAPVVNAANGYAFEADVLMFDINTVTNASIQPPAPAAAQSLTSASDTKLELKHKYDSLSKLDSHYTNGVYVFAINGKNDGTRQCSLVLFNNAYPNGPHLQNYPALQSVNAQGYFQAAWDPFLTGTTNDFVQLHIEDLNGNKLFETPDFGDAGALDGTATHALVAPGPLTSGRTNLARLTFQSQFAINPGSYPGALGHSSYYSRTTFFLMTTTAAAPEVETFEVTKTRKWLQTNATSLLPEPGQEFEFEASVQAYKTGILTSGTVLLPPTTNSPSRNLVLQQGGTKLDFTAAEPTQSLLDASYGSGNYILNFTVPVAGNKSLTLPLPTDAFPPAPRVANFDAIQTLNVNHPATISWDPWNGGSLNDFVQLRIEDHQNNKLFETPDLGKSNALDGRATNAVIPAGALPAGQSVEVHLTFKRLVAIDTTSFSAVLGVSSFSARTKFDIQTIASDARTYGVAKGQQFVQRDRGTVVALASSSFVFNSFVEATVSNSVLNASVQTPPGTTRVLDPQPGGRQYYFSAAFPTRADLDAGHPNGGYLMNIAGATDGAKSLPLNLAGDLYPAAPHLANFPATQSVVASNTLTLTWDAFPGGTFNDFIQLLIKDLSGSIVFQTPSLGSTGALTGLATSSIIPAGTLSSNQAYYGQLLFKKLTVAGSTNYPGALGFAGYFSSTQFRLVTRGSGNPAALAVAWIPSNRLYQVSSTAVPGLSYRIEGSSNLVQWAPLTTNTAVTSTFKWLDSVIRPMFFYRSLVLPE
jgi:hypothetical protein